MPEPITLPTRAVLEELFPTKAHFVVDALCRRELRALGEVVRMLEQIADTERAHNDENHALHAYHYGIMGPLVQKALVAAGASLQDDGITRAMEERMLGATAEQMEFLMRSFTCCLLLLAIGRPQATVGPDGQPTIAHDIGQSMALCKVLPNILSRWSVARSVLRDHPEVRFDSRLHLQLRVHWDDLDNEGVPRVSNDGYCNI